MAIQVSADVRAFIQSRRGSGRATRGVARAPGAERRRGGRDRRRMDVVKVFVEDPAALGGGRDRRPQRPSPPRPRRSSPRLRAPATPFARAYLAGTVLGRARRRASG